MKNHSHYSSDHSIVASPRVELVERSLTMKEFLQIHYINSDKRCHNKMGMCDEPTYHNTGVP